MNALSSTFKRITKKPSSNLKQRGRHWNVKLESSVFKIKCCLKRKMTSNRMSKATRRGFKSCNKNLCS